MRDGFPIALGYFAVSFSLGIAARHAGFTPMQGFWASLLCHNASAGEYAAFTLIAARATYWEVAVITLIANARYLLMSCALAQRFAPGTPFWHRLVIGYDVTDELFGITIARPGYLNPYYTYGAIMLAAPGWAVGTALGILAGNALPLRVVSALKRGAVRHVLGHHHPAGAEKPHHCGAGGAAFALSLACNYLPGVSAMSDGTRTILLTVLISAAAAVLFPVGDQLAEEAAAMNNYIYIAVMALVSYTIRILPLTLIRKPIRNRFIQSFLYYVPYVTLAVMTFPAIIHATQTPISGAVALAAGIIAAWLGAGLFPVSVICCALVFAD